MSDTFAIWFVATILSNIVEQQMFVAKLRKLGINVPFLQSGSLIYLDFIYFNWCLANGPSPYKRLLLRGALFANLVAVVVLALSEIPDK